MPWSIPGLQPGQDYEAGSFFILEQDELLHQEGWLQIDFTSPVRRWLTGDPNRGVLLRLPMTVLAWLILGSTRVSPKIRTCAPGLA